MSLIEITAADGHRLSAYVARPDGEVRGAIVILQEIFGVNAHIRSVADQYAQAGYIAIAPAIFDRLERGVELGYDAESTQKARSYYEQIEVHAAVMDVEAAIALGRDEADNVAVVGYCFGGLLAWIAATRGNGLIAAVGYYGGGIPARLDTAPKVPMMLHFGAEDDHIPIETLSTITETYPEVEMFIYDGAGHGFNCSDRPSFALEASVAALARTLAFIEQAMQRGA